MIRVVSGERAFEEWRTLTLDEDNSADFNIKLLEPARVKYYTRRIRECSFVKTPTGKDVSELIIETNIDLSEKHMRDAAIEAVTGWRGIEDDDTGEELELSTDNMDKLNDMVFNFYEWVWEQIADIYATQMLKSDETEKN